jgi:signal transduction histidine kinase/CheY-like chemotaxis protein/PAS domain-containing protein
VTDFWIFTTKPQLSLHLPRIERLVDIEIEILFELSLSVGGSLDLDVSTREFLLRNIKLLNRTAGAVLRQAAGKDGAYAVMHSVPRNFPSGDELNAILQRSGLSAINATSEPQHSRYINPDNGLSYELFVVPDFGILLLAGTELALSKTFYGHFRQILKKFAAACQACMINSDNEQQAYRLKLATRAARIGTWEMDIETGQLTVDSRIQELFGITDGRSNFSLHEFFQFVHAEDKPAVIKHVRNYIEQAIDEPTEYYFRIFKADHEIRKLAANATLLFEGHKPTKLVGVNYDVTEIELARTQSLYRSQLENLLVSLSVDLIKNHYRDINEVVTNALGKAGEFVGADRAYRFMYDFENGVCSNTHEWCAEGIVPELEYLQNISVNEIRLWVTAHRAGLPFFIKSVQELPEQHGLRRILEPQGIQSLVTIPLMHDEQCMGFIGFDAVRNERLWTDVDLTLLRLLADLLVNADIRIKHEILINEQNQALTTARDHAEYLAGEANLANAAKSRFVARVSHEIRTPLHAILGLADLVLAEHPSEQIQHLTKTIRESGSILLDLINDVLDFSKAESNEVVLSVAQFNLPELLTTLERMFRPLAEKKQLNFHIEMDPQVHGDFLGDRLRIRQILTNLLSNAIKFSTHGSVELYVSLSQPAAEQLCFKVSDSGMGIPKEDLDKLFLPFFQSSNTDSLTLSGTGLGLTISHALAERMNGSIRVESKLGEGSTFCFEVPLERAETTTPVQEALAGATSGVDLSALNILVAEDNMINIQLIKAYLKDNKGTLICVNDGLQAYEASLDFTDGFDIILMDCNMPVMNGFEATRAIRASERGRRHTPVIAVTAGALDGEKSDCLAAGMDDVLVKPFTRRELLNMIEQWAGKSYSVQ